jgi:hypothetical protein
MSSLLRRCRSRGGGNPALDNPVGITLDVEASIVLSAAFPKLFLGWIPASAGTTVIFAKSYLT